MAEDTIFALDDPAFLNADPELYGLLYKLIAPTALQRDNKSTMRAARLMISEAIRMRLKPGVIIQIEKISGEFEGDYRVELIDRESEKTASAEADNVDDALARAYAGMAGLWQMCGLMDGHRARVTPIPRTSKKPFLKAALAGFIRHLNDYLEANKWRRYLR